jgi:hypothetical protein
MSKDTNAIARLLSRHALAVCQTYLPNGRMTGNHWIIGNLSGDKGRSMHVRLHGPDYGPGAAGKWTDYVASLVMLRISSCVLWRGKFASSAQHNTQALRGVM